MEYYSAKNRNKNLPLVATLIDLKGIKLSEIRQRKTNTACFHLYVKYKKNENSRTQNRLGATRGGKVGEGGGEATK